MAIRADSNMTFHLRFLLIGLVAFGYGLWSAYDGWIGYPHQIVRAEKYHELAQEPNFETRWVDYAREQGWSLEDPGEPKSQADIYYNYFMAVLCIPVGLWLLHGVFAARGRWIEADERGISSSWGQQLSYDEIRELDKRRWRNKGIAKVFYEQDGRRKRLVIDDFKFKREPADDILRQIEERIDPELITGGPPEPPPEAAVVPMADDEAS